MLSPFSVTRKGTLKSNNGEDSKDFKKVIGLYVKQQLSMYNTLFFYIPLPSLQGHDVKMTDFTFNRGRKNADEESFFLFLNLDMVLRNSIPGSRRVRLHLTNVLISHFKYSRWRLKEREFTF